MTKRYFYTDPLKALWMAKHFDMCFTMENDGFIYSDWEEIMGEHLDTCYRGKWCIYSDSENILEPKVGDGIDLSGMELQDSIKRIIPDDYISKNEVTICLSDAKILGAGIILCDGKAFFIPESEEV